MNKLNNWIISNFIKLKSDETFRFCKHLINKTRSLLVFHEHVFRNYMSNASKENQNNCLKSKIVYIVLLFELEFNA